MGKLIYVRHGQSVRNVEGVFAGGKDDTPLTEEGRKQAAQAGRTLVEEPIKRIIASPLGRTQETATIIANEIGFDPLKIETDDRLVEYDIGAGNGKNVEGMTAAQMVSFDGAEDPDAFRNRVTAALNDIKNTLDQGTVLVVAHGGVGRMIECARLGKNPAGFYDAPGYPNAEPVILDLSWLEHDNH